MALVKTNVGDALPLVASGKVRELYAVDSKSLLFVATDRISAYDVIMKNGIPQKGVLLTLMTAHWFQYLQNQIPTLKTHFLSLDLPPSLPDDVAAQLKGRSMLVRKLKVFPLEAIVRGYITGSAWSSYKRTGEVNGRKMPEGLQESQEFPEPIYTPSTKAELGEHDENISIEHAAKIVGEKHAKRIEELSLQIYKAARDYARERGIIIADTKFEFGLDEETDEVVLIDEVLTPDSSRFWPKSNYQVGQGQSSFDKQGLRDWLTQNGLKGKDDVEMPDDVVEATRAKYLEAFKVLTGKSLEAALGAMN
ncbi:phosphoribosylaminoimidazolesuccinocarboxamide synthase [Cladophialophora carrionii CBS 160.54]|uniref:Phosphoribosylaminoimidazole-succinocarboxamide synthase n=1 Tax=Cladophialophora carrionii CBS 160.54 TaxID=1279043 RepID=V9DIS9_9EURO|nr:phosphoribosylaminoimidazolesuccinocarboxamide synthase [Cladophialophora carrionii CBS 160.54]ETI26809.1 phosphoribosylaminoimidazolesuccinocarboxamide synthase [Cladophialophora carrionii CBS 160.54]